MYSSTYSLTLLALAIGNVRTLPFLQPLKLTPHLSARYPHTSKLLEPPRLERPRRHQPPMLRPIPRHRKHHHRQNRSRQLDLPIQQRHNLLRQRARENRRPIRMGNRARLRRKRCSRLAPILRREPPSPCNKTH